MNESGSAFPRCELAEKPRPWDPRIGAEGVQVGTQIASSAPLPASNASVFLVSRSEELTQGNVLSW